MKGFYKIFIFELKYRFHRWDTYIYFLAFLIFGFYSIASSAIFHNYGGAGQRVYANSSITIGYFISTMSIWLIAISAALMSVPIIRDKETKTYNYYYALPITKGGYLLGRYAGTFLILVFVSLGVLVGIIAGYYIPGHDPATLQPFHLSYFVRPYLILILSNLIISSLIFFAVVNFTRHVLGGYMIAVVIIALNMISQQFFDPQNLALYCYIDPYGVNAFYMSIRGWTILQRNTGLLPFGGWILFNRLLWLGVGVVLFVISYLRFDFGKWMKERQKGKRVKEEKQKTDTGQMALPIIIRDFKFKSQLKHLFNRSLLELGYHLKTVFFIVMVFAAGFILFYQAFAIAYPTTGQMLQIKNGYFSIFALVILVFFAGEAVNRERELKLANITDTLPAPNWMFTGSKLLSIIGIAFLLSTLILIAIVFTLVYKGDFDINWYAYLTECYLIMFPYYVLLAILAFCIQVIVRNKFIGHTIMILFFILNIVAKSLGIEHNLLFYGAPPKPISGPLANWAGYSITYSDMNGYGPFAAGRFWFTIYWLFFALLLLTVVNMLWKRGIELRLRERIHLMKERFNTSAKVSLLVLFLCFIGCGSFIYYNTNILNEYLPQTSIVPLERRANYEKKYKQYENAPLPWITHIKMEAELYPDQRKADLTFHFLTENRTSHTIDTLFLTYSRQFDLTNFAVGNDSVQEVFNDKKLEFYACKLAHPIRPGEKRDIIIKGNIAFHGFLNETGPDVARFSPKYMSLSSYDLPILGYTARKELSGTATRKKFGLTTTYTATGMNDSIAQRANIWSPVSDWISVETTIGTNGKQTGIAAGKLQKKWISDGRNYFYYSTDTNRIPFTDLHLYSGQFKFLHHLWKSPDGRDSVSMQLFCYSRHTGNADSLFSISGYYLGYLHQSGGSIPMHLLRYVEMPYGMGTVSEGMMTAHFIGRKNMPDFMDFPLSNFILSDYFSHRLLPAKVAGAGIYGGIGTFFSNLGIESEYSGFTYPQVFSYSTISYLSGRASERVRERPVYDCYNIPYMSNKTATALGSLRYMIGNDKYKKLLLNFCKQHSFQGPPYLVSTDLINYLRPYAPDSMKQRFDEEFYKIILYKNKIRQASAHPLSDGRFEIKIQAETHKMEDDGLGNEKNLPQNEYIDVGICTAANTTNNRIADVVIPVKMHEGINNFVLYSKSAPTEVIIDPHYVLMNLTLLSGKRENMKKVKMEKSVILTSAGNSGKK